ncbi:MAG: FGGY family carbohydrate kinase [Actinomycetales bacterium]
MSDPRSGFGTSYLGIDIGTSVAKAALFDDLGDLVAVASRPVDLSHPAPGHVEQDAGEVLDMVMEVVAAVRTEAGGDAPEVVGITAQGDGCWLLDDKGSPTRQAISWMDGRGHEILTDWQQSGVLDKIFRINGNALFPGCMAPILAWLDTHEPQTLDRSATAAYCKDMIFSAFTGERATDASDASLPFGNATGDGYSDEALELTGLSHRKGLLAPVETPLPSAPVNLAGSASLGLAPATAVVSGPFDMAACAIGGGVRELGDGLLIVGTTLACQVLVDSLDVDGEPSGWHLSTPTPGRWLRAMPSMVGSASLDWILKTLGRKHSELEQALATSAPGAGGVEVLPYFAPSGERAPFVDSRATGQYTGVRLTTTQEDLIRATCEGLAYAARDCFDAAGLTGRLVVCGGGARSRAWLRIFASVLNRPLLVARSPQVGAKGAVVAALDTVGIEYDVPEWARPETTIDPDPAVVEMYEDGFQRYRAHRDSARDLWR